MQEIRRLGCRSADELPRIRHFSDNTQQVFLELVKKNIMNAIPAPKVSKPKIEIFKSEELQAISEVLKTNSTYRRYYLLFLLILIDCCLLILSAIYTLPFNYLYFISIFDLITCIFIFTDFLYGLYKSKDKKEYIKDNWMNIIASIPIDFFLLRMLRFFKLLKLFKLFKIGKFSILFRNEFKTFYKFIKEIYLDKIFLSIIVVILCSSLFFYFIASDSITLIDSFWFVISSITTVGYGDIVPSSSEGKILAMLLVIIGFISLSVLTGSISAAYSNKVIINNETDDLKEEIRNLNNKIDNLTKSIEELKIKEK